MMAEPTTIPGLILTILESFGVLLLMVVLFIVVAVLLVSLVTATRSLWWDRVVPLIRRWFDWIDEEWDR